MRNFIRGIKGFFIGFIIFPLVAIQIWIEDLLRKIDKKNDRIH